MNGVTATSMVLLSPSQVQAGWKVRGVVDLNADGNSDLLWQHDNGSVAAWLMQGITATIMRTSCQALWASSGTWPVRSSTSNVKSPATR